MLSIIKSFAVIVAMAAIIGGTTYSFFSATDTIAGNTISTAEVVFDAVGESNGTTLAKPIDADDLYPGAYSDWARAALKNESVFPVKLFMYVDNLDGSACPLVDLLVTTGEEGSDESERTRIVYEGDILDIAGEAEMIELTGLPPFAVAPSGGQQIIQQRARLDEDADNGTQNEECVWDEIFVARSVPPEDAEEDD